MRQRAGEEHFMARIPDAVVREMREIYASWKAAGSWKGYGELAKIFGVSMWTVRDIVTYRTRKSA